MQAFLFKPLCENDLDLLFHWFQEPDINKWYARGKNWSFNDIKQKYLPRILAAEKIQSFIIYKNKLPIGFIQYYCLRDHFPEGIKGFNHSIFKSFQAEELIGIDFFLAYQADRGKGLGELILNCFIAQLPANTKAVIVDPESDNYRAIRCYLKTGFQSTNFSEDKVYLLLLKILPETISE